MVKLANLNELLGKTLASVEVVDDKELRFATTDGKRYRLSHEEVCCETVRIESIVGDLADLVGEPLLMAEQSTGETPNDYRFKYEPESYTWTFYKFATRNGYVDVRWLGESNGEYGKEVEFVEFYEV